MAYNEIQVGRFLRYFQKVFSMKGREPSEISLAPEIMPVLPILAGGVEDRSIQGWSTFAVGFSVAAVAAQTSKFKIRNPAGSNVVVVIEQLSLFEGATDFFLLDYEPDTADFATVQAAEPIDGRNPVGNATAIVSKANSGAPAANFWILDALANTQVNLVQEYDHEVALFPGFSIAGFTNALNVQLFVCLRWRERFLEESERK